MHAEIIEPSKPKWVDLSSTAPVSLSNMLEEPPQKVDQITVQEVDAILTNMTKVEARKKEADENEEFLDKKRKGRTQKQKIGERQLKI